MLQINAKDIRYYKQAGFIESADWNRPKKNNKKSRNGKNNPMYNQSAVRGKRWVTFKDGTSKLLSESEINSLTCFYYYGRQVDKNKSQRIIIESELKSSYMTDDAINNLPTGTKYQYGLQWKNNRTTFIIQ